ncbi:MAG: hypothetical protein KGS72_11610 [Cyanobacteria bacterium REEB67]|nr:hypothetical protein [Cyanobacteria bacterium REEB67]
MTIRKNKSVLFAAALSLALSLTCAQAATAPTGNQALKTMDNGIEKLDMTGAPKLQFFKPLPLVKPADVAPSNAPNTSPTVNPATTPSTTGSPSDTTKTVVPTITPGTSPDITPQQVEKFLADRGFDADKAKQAANPTPEMLDQEFVGIWSFIAQKYYNGDKLSNWQVWPTRYAGKLKTRDDLNAAVATMLSSLGDRWTVFTSIESMLRGQTQASPDIEYVGIGLAQNSNGSFRVEALEYNSPVWTTNMVRPGDIVEQVNTVDAKGAVTTHVLKGMSKEDASKLMIGHKGDKITLVIGHDGKDDKVDVALTDTPPEQIEVGMLPNRIGYVRLPSFGTSEDEANTLGNNFLRALGMLDAKANGHLTGIVLDLRANHGGAVDLAKKIARIFIDHGTFLQTQERDGGTDKFEKDVFRAPMAYEYVGMPKEIVALFARLKTVPMTILVDGSSASSAEILTGTMKDNGRALVIGTQTFGKAVAFVRIPTPAGMLQVTTMHYLTPNGYDLANKGITPDIVIDRTRGADGVDEQLVTAAQVLLAANNSLSTKADPNAVQTQGSDAAFGGESLLMMGLGLGGMLLVIVLTVYNGKKRKERDEQEKKDRK